MPSRRASTLLATAALLLAGLSGCSDADGSPDATATPPDVARAVARTLDARAHAVLHGDAARFEHLLAGGPGFRAAQRTWFGNLTQLPVARLRYRVHPDSLVREGDRYSVVADVELELDGYDAGPVVAPGRFAFRAVPHHPSRFRLTGADLADPQPWDLGPVEVREGDGVLGVFDAGSVADAPGLVASVESGIASVAAQVPYDWSRSVVVYALSDPTFLDGLQDVPGDDPEDLDAVAFPVGDSTRVALNPRMLDEAGAERDRLVRHELTHVAVGTHDDDVPVWLSEGLAEYVSVRPLAPQDRRIPEAAVAAAEAGVDDLPDDASFNDDDSEAHYGLAWWAVESLADSFGPSGPWQLLDALAEPGADPDEVLRDRFGTSMHQLAEEADRLILSLYAAGG
ncbi:peptidase MA family metallohydrolase [Nocardioides sp.]|uniref:peptidase MA family metallohydrolase n=1 Tax=Nocardioides sp. TaxID=35761 RepID=UPI003783E3E8